MSRPILLTAFFFSCASAAPAHPKDACDDISQLRVWSSGRVVGIGCDVALATALGLDTLRLVTCADVQRVERAWQDFQASEFTTFVENSGSFRVYAASTDGRIAMTIQPHAVRQEDCGSEFARGSHGARTQVLVEPGRAVVRQESSSNAYEYQTFGEQWHEVSRALRERDQQ